MNAGYKQNKHKAATFITPNTNAGTFRLPANNLSEIIPESTVPTIPQIELIEIMKLASNVSYPFVPASKTLPSCSLHSD